MKKAVKVVRRTIKRSINAASSITCGTFGLLLVTRSKRWIPKLIGSALCIGSWVQMKEAISPREDLKDCKCDYEEVRTVNWTDGHR